MATLTVDEAKGFAEAAGFTGVPLEVVVAIAQAESGLVTDARNGPAANVPPSIDRGILQINSYWNASYSDACCDDPACAFRAAYEISKGGTDFTPWSTYTGGEYKAFMTDIPRNPAPLSQLHEPTKDGLPDENTSNNCGETSAAWVVRDIGNEPDCDGDEIHDLVIGQGSVGGSNLLDPANSGQLNPKYVAALAGKGVSLSLYRGNQAALVAKAHEVLNLSAGDVLANFGGGSNYLASFTDPVNFNGFGHICVLAHNLQGGIQLMDPWIGDWRSYKDSQLEQMIVWGYIVVALPLSTGAVAPAPSPVAAPAVASPSLQDISTVSYWYTANPDGSWLASKTGHTVKGAILVWYRTLNCPSAHLPFPGLPVTEETALPLGSATLQVFERAFVVNDPNHAYDGQPGFGDVYLGKPGDPRLNPALGAAIAHLADAQANAAQVVTLQNELKQVQSDAANAVALQDKVTKIHDGLTALLASLG